MILASPDDRLRRAAAVVFVDDLEAPACTDDDAHHLLEVLRLEPGADVAASDGRGRYRHCRLLTAEARRRKGAPRAAVLEPVGDVVDERPTVPHRAEPATVAFALVKGERTEWAVQKLTELGVDRIVPLLTARTIVRLDADGAARRADRLRRVAREAAAQARRTTLPAVALPTTLDRYLADGTPDGLPPPPPDALALAEPGGAPLEPATRCVVVGPEGGWTDDELTLVDRRVGLGRLVLRAETAAVVAGVLLTHAP